MDNSRYLGSVLIVTGSAFNSAIYKVIKLNTKQEASRSGSSYRMLMLINPSYGKSPPPPPPQVLYQRMFGFWSIAQMSLFFTIVGLFNALLLWPFALLFYFLGIEIIACKCSNIII